MIILKYLNEIINYLDKFISYNDGQNIISDYNNITILNSKIALTKLDINFNEKVKYICSKLSINYNFFYTWCTYFYGNYPKLKLIEKYFELIIKKNNNNFSNYNSLCLCFIMHGKNIFVVDNYKNICKKFGYNSHFNIINNYQFNLNTIFFSDKYNINDEDKIFFNDINIIDKKIFSYLNSYTLYKINYFLLHNTNTFIINSSNNFFLFFCKFLLSHNGKYIIKNYDIKNNFFYDFFNDMKIDYILFDDLLFKTYKKSLNYIKNEFTIYH